jgi:hypothetical protein
MSERKENIQQPLMGTEECKIDITAAKVPSPVTWNQFEYKEESSVPKITFTGLTMVILSPLLICAHVRAAGLAGIPIIQFTFCTTLFAFLLNYTAIIRKFELRPFLPEAFNDSKLKRICLMGVIAIMVSMIYGWNGSGGVIFALGWEGLRGNKMGAYGLMLGVIIIGCLLME